jgi:hypothetical protein
MECIGRGYQKNNPQCNISFRYFIQTVYIKILTTVQLVEFLNVDRTTQTHDPEE